MRRISCWNRHCNRAAAQESEPPPSGRDFPAAKPPRHRVRTGKMDTCSARPAPNNDFTPLDKLGPEKRQTCFQYFWLPSHGSVSHMTILWFLKKKKNLKKKENRRILPIKNPATRIQMGLTVSFSHNNLARKVGNWDYIMCATKLRL